MSSSGSGWRPPFCDSRTGAAHHRRGAPCQDASGLWCCVDGSGAPVQLLVVSDGHGGARYDRSDVGSRLACEVALRIAWEQLGSPAALGASQQEWSQWLADDLPRRIVARWRQQVLAHAEAHPRADGAAPSTIPYGATLGLLLLTPRWWGCTGLGDWDLVRLDGEGRGELLSQEPDTPGGVEATFSLCMQGSERYFAPRSSVHAIAAEAAPFSLLLSSDGIRKSCASDADFITLAHYLCGLDPTRRDQQGSELSQSLDHISSQGSGDDVSVVIGRWGPLLDSERRPRRGVSTPTLVQPQLTPEAIAAAPSAVAEAPQAAEAHRQAQAALADAAVDRPRTGPSPWLVGAMAAAGLAAAAWVAAHWLAPGSFARRQPQPFSAQQLAVLGREAQRLCADEGDGAAQVGAVAVRSRPAGAGAAAGDGARPARSDAAARLPSPRRPAVPEGLHTVSSPPDAAGDPSPTAALDRARTGRIQAGLNQRKRMFSDLAQASRSPHQLLVSPERDPLGALIAWSALQPGLGAPQAATVAPEASRRPAPGSPIAWLQARLGAGEPPPRQVPVVPLCPELREVLRQQWQAARSPSRTQGPEQGASPGLAVGPMPERSVPASPAVAPDAGKAAGSGPATR